MGVIDTDALLRAFILTKPAILSAVGTRVFMSSDPPAGYHVVPSGNSMHGPCLVIPQQGGSQNETGVLLTRSATIRSYAATEYDARLIDRLVTEVLDGSAGGRIRSITAETWQQYYQETQTNWFVAFTVFKIQYVIR